MTTDKQKAAIHFCEKWSNVTFNGDINNFQQVRKLHVSMNLIYGT